MSRTRHIAAFLSALVLMALAACGGGTVGGTVSGLPSGESVTLQNNGRDDLTITTNGTFEFSDSVLENSSYSVTVSVQPNTATCTVSNGTGTITSSDGSGNDLVEISDVVVTCTSTGNIAGTLTGLAQGTFVKLINSGTSGSGTSAPLTLTSNGTFAFPGIKDAGTTYTVTVATDGQPIGQTCTVTNGTGTVVANTAISIAVSCTP